MKVAILSLNWREENFQNFLVFFLGSKYLLTLSVKDQIFQFFLRFVPYELILNCVDVSGMASIRKDTRLRFFFFKNVSACLNCHFMQASVRWWLIFALSYSTLKKKCQNHGQNLHSSCKVNFRFEPKIDLLPNDLMIHAVEFHLLFKPFLDVLLDDMRYDMNV